MTRRGTGDGGYPEPVWEANGFTTAIFRPNTEVRAQAEAEAGARRAVGPAGAQSRAQSGAQSAQVLVALTEGARSAAELAEAIGLRSKTGALKRTLGEPSPAGSSNAPFRTSPRAGFSATGSR